MAYDIKNNLGEVIFSQNIVIYNGEYMGERSVSCTVTSPVVLPFNAKSYIDYRGERFKLYSTPVPTVKKKADSGSLQDAFTYELKFLSQESELQFVAFVDLVPDDSTDYYSGSSNVEFKGDASYLRDRIQACLDERYIGSEKWTLLLAPNLQTEQLDISGSDISCWDALMLFNTTEKWQLNVTFSGKTITIGELGDELPIAFEYGKGKGLYEITRTAIDSEAIITRLRAYGGTDIIPENYKREGTGRVAPDYQYITELMLPAYASIPNATVNATGKGLFEPLVEYGAGDLVKYTDGKRYYCLSDETPIGTLPTNATYFTPWTPDYIDSTVGIASYGIRDGIFRDETIFPSLKEITGDQLRLAGVTTGAVGRVDEILATSKILTENQSYFYVFIKDIGFDINQHKIGGATVQLSTIDTPTGLGGYTFDVTDVRETTTEENTAISGAKYRLTLNVNQDDKFNIPSISNGLYPNSTGDYLLPLDDFAHFVLLGIDMPQAYVLAKEQLLLTKAQEYLAKNDHPKVSYEIGIDEIQMARFGIGVSGVIKEGCLMGVFDADLGIGTSSENPQYIPIQTLTITEGVSVIPTYQVSLSDKPIASTLGQLTNDIKKTQDVILENSKLNQAVTDRITKTVNGLNWITQAMGGATEQLGGLLLTNLLFMRDQDGNINGGMSGVKGDNILNWGGGSYDEALSSLVTPNGVAFINREDGSGHNAFGNITWDGYGNAEYKGKVKANQGGYIGGLNISESSLYSASMEFSESPVESLSSLKTPLSVAVPYENSWDGVNSAHTQYFTVTQISEITFSVRFVGANIARSVIIEDNSGNKILDTNSVIPTDYKYVLQAGTYRIRAWATPSATIPSHNVLISIFGATGDLSNIYAVGFVKKTKIGNDGWYSFWDSDNYEYYSASYGKEIRVGTQGIKIDSTGNYKWKDSTSSWVKDNVMITPPRNVNDAGGSTDWTMFYQADTGEIMIS